MGSFKLFQLYLLYNKFELHHVSFASLCSSCGRRMSRTGGNLTSHHGEVPHCGHVAAGNKHTPLPNTQGDGSRMHCSLRALSRRLCWCVLVQERRKVLRKNNDRWTKTLCRK